jgi:hypothetical protein
MHYLLFWALTCFLGWTSLQATTSSIETSEADCRPSITDLFDDPVPFESIFAFVYNDNTKVKSFAYFNDATGGYLIKSPVIFNSQGPQAKITYDQATGELTVPVAGNYEIIYTLAAVSVEKGYGNKAVDKMALAVNGKKVAKSEKNLVRRDVPLGAVTSATIVLKLAKGDRISLILPDAPTPAVAFLVSTAIEGNSVSLFIKKI